MTVMIRLSGSARANLVVLVVVSALLAACSQSGGDVVPTPPSLTFDVQVDSTVDVTSGEASSDIADGSTDPDPSATADDSSVSTEPTIPVQETIPPAPTSLAPVTTTEPIAIQELLLRGDGIGSAVFGAAPDGVIEYVTSLLGGNTGDTGWVDNFAFAACDGTRARRVDWGVLSLLFGDLSLVAGERDHFMAWEYGRIGELGGDPVGLRTPGGTTLGTRIIDLLAEFPDASVNPGEEDLNSPPNFYVSDSFRGLVTGVADDEVVTVIFGGRGCGE